MLISINCVMVHFYLFQVNKALFKAVQYNARLKKCWRQYKFMFSCNKAALT